jgi:hypothetical protein
MNIFEHHQIQKQKVQAKKKAKKRKTPEKDFQKFFVNLLRDNGHLVFETYQKKVFFDSDGNKHLNLNQKYIKGTFDLIVCNKNNLKYYEIDCKSKTGRPSDTQKERMEKYKEIKVFYFASPLNYLQLMKELDL